MTAKQWYVRGKVRQTRHHHHLACNTRKNGTRTRIDSALTAAIPNPPSVKHNYMSSTNQICSVQLIIQLSSTAYPLIINPSQPTSSFSPYLIITIPHQSPYLTETLPSIMTNPLAYVCTTCTAHLHACMQASKQPANPHETN